MSFKQRLIDQLPALRRYATALAGQQLEPDELVQMTIERALARSHLFVTNKNLRPWLYSILHNLYIDQLRRGRDQFSEDGQSQTISYEPRPEVVPDLEKALAQLSLENRQVLLLAGLEGFSYREIAKALDIPQGTVMSRLSRARQQMQLLLGDGYNDTPATHSTELRRVK